MYSSFYAILMEFVLQFVMRYGVASKAFEKSRMATSNQVALVVFLQEVVKAKVSH